MNSMNLAISIRKLYQLSMQAMERELLRIDITPQQMMVLKLLAHEGKLQHHSLMEKMEISKGTMSGILKRLEDKQLIRREVMDHDRRNITFSFTDKGEAFAEQFHELMNRAMTGLFNEVSAADFARYQQTLSEMIHYLEEQEHAKIR